MDEIAELVGRIKALFPAGDSAEQMYHKWLTDEAYNKAVNKLLIDIKTQGWVDVKNFPDFPEVIPKQN